MEAETGVGFHGWSSMKDELNDAEFRAELARIRELRREGMMLRRRERQAHEERLAQERMTLGRWLWLPFAMILALPSVLIDGYRRRQVLRLTRENRGDAHAKGDQVERPNGDHLGP